MLLLVDDILDTGRTLLALTAELRRRGALEVKSCVFLDKPSRRSVDYEADYRVFPVEDLFVVFKKEMDGKLQKLLVRCMGKLGGTRAKELLTKVVRLEGGESTPIAREARKWLMR